MSMSMSMQRSIRARWAQALLLGNRSDWLKATVARDAFAPYETRTEAYAWLQEHLNIKAPSTKSTLAKMADAIAVVPDEDVWVAVGWSGVSRLVPLTRRDREKKIKTIRSRADGGELPKQTVGRILPAPNDRAEPAAKVSPMPANADHLLAEELRRLLSDPTLGPLLRANVRPAVLKVLKSKKTA